MMSKYVKRFECDLLTKGAVVSVGGRCNLLIERLMLDSTLNHNPHLTQKIPALLRNYFADFLCGGTPPPPLKTKYGKKVTDILAFASFPHPPHLLQTISRNPFTPKQKLLEVMILLKETCFIASILGEESVID